MLNIFGLLQYWQARLRHLKFNEYKDRKFILMMNQGFHPIVEDFITYTIDLPDEFYALKLETDCYEAPIPSAHRAMTPPDVYARLIEYLRSFYNKDKAIEIWPPRGCDKHINQRPQTFVKYMSNLPNDSERPIIVVFPRARSRASQRNVPEFVWKGLVDYLKNQFHVVLGGTPDGACLVDYQDENVTNLINYTNADKLDKIIHYCFYSALTISSQSGPTHLAEFCGAPCYIIGHEKERHCIYENRFDVPTAFRTVPDYRAIDSNTILQDLQGFINDLISYKILLPNLKRDVVSINRPSLRTLKGKKDLVGVEIGVDEGENSLNMLMGLDIKKLYLIDTWDVFDGLDGKGGFAYGIPPNSEVGKQHYEKARKLLEPYKDKVQWIQKKSEDAISDIKERVDFVYIDGCHLYNYVKKDIELYQKIVKDGGLVAGHDFDSDHVKIAVDNTVDKSMTITYDKSADCPAYDWWYYKPSKYDDILEKDIETMNGLIK